MYALLIYSLKAGACLAAFYLLFKLLLSRETFHRFNRVLLLGFMLLSFVLPVCVITVYREAPALPDLPLSAAVPAAALPAAAEVAPAPFPWETLWGGLFLLGAVASLAATLLSIGGVVRLIRRGRCEKLDDGVVLVRLSEPVTPFSWGHYIVVSERDLAESGAEILLHERAHLRLHHSLDLLVTDLAAPLQWFNPAMWLLRRELRALHEYEADEAVLASGVDAKRYQLLLIKKAAGGRWYSIANSFNHSKLKNRITMMLRKRSPRRALAKALFAVPLTGLALASFARTAYVVPKDEATKFESILQDEPPTVRTKADSVVYVMQAVPKKENRIEVRMKSDSVVYIMQTAPRKETRIETRMQPADEGRQTMQSTVVVTAGEKPDVRQLHGKVVRIEGGGDSSRVVTIEGSDADAMQRNIILIDGRETTPDELRGIDPSQFADIRFVNPLPEAYKDRDADGVIEITTRDRAAQPTAPDSVKMDEIVVVGFGSGSKDLSALVQKNREQDGGPGPIILIDGREVEPGMLSDPSQFESITVLKSLPERYKDCSSNGAVLITTRNAPKRRFGKAKAADTTTLSVIHGSVIRSRNDMAVMYAPSTDNDPRFVPLYVIDGREAMPDELNGLPANNPNISIEIFKDSEHIEQYAKKFGEKARNGIVVVTTKGRKSEPKK